jgi:hypothetical protein
MNNNLELHVASDGRQVVLADRQRGCEWRLDPATRLADETVLPDGSVERLPDGFRVTHRLPAGTIIYRWTLAGDHVRVELECAPASIGSISLPGAFLPGEGKAAMLLSAQQGVLYRPMGDHWLETRPPWPWWGFGMAMSGLLGARGGLLITQESITDWECSFGEKAAGTLVFYRENICPVQGWYRREVRLYPVDSNITAVAKRYRKRVQERGEFVSWEEKIARKPVVEKLFGALFAFTGYNHAPEVDYVASAQRLRESGFDTVLYYPVRMAHYTQDFQMGGDKPIWLPDETLQRIREVPGALVAPWGWIVEGLDDGSPEMQRIFRRNADGSAPDGWKIEKQQWHLVCPGEQVATMRRWYADDLKAMDWIHYDVCANYLGRQVCYAKNHPAHPDGPLAATGEVELTRQLFSAAINGNRIVSSEGFMDRYTTQYDVGTTKLWPACGPDAEFIPVPLTGLVFHDSTIHNRWEMDNYNFLPGFEYQRRSFFGSNGSGGGQKLAAQDALEGCPPHVFPFGRQYSWVDFASRRTFSFCLQLSDVNVQAALQLARPVAQLHRRIGKLEMAAFDLLTEDAAVQTSQFADGTRIVANISDKKRDAGPHGVLAPNSWKEIKS